MLDRTGVCREGPGGGKEASRHLELHNHDCFNHLHSPHKYCDSIIHHNDQVQVDLPWWWGGRAISPPKKICFNAALVFDLFIFCIFLVPHLPGVGDEGRLLSDPSLHLGR